MFRAPPRSSSKGFTLIEIMIAVLVVGVLAAISYPSFLDSIRKSRRAEAITALAQVQQAQERWRSNNANYTTSLTDLGLNSSTPSNYYAISVAASASAPLSTGYVASAVGKAGTSQANDTQCRQLSVQLIGGNLSYAGCGSCGSYTYTPTHPCWAR